MNWPKTAAVLVITLVSAPLPQRSADGDWRSIGRDPGAQRFSPLAQITKANVASLRQAWTFDTGAEDLQVTPLVIDGLMYARTS